jgi:hypothetical protein
MYAHVRTLRLAGQEKAAEKSIAKAIKEIDARNALIEQGEPKVGVELTPNTPQA